MKPVQSPKSECDEFCFFLQWDGMTLFKWKLVNIFILINCERCIAKVTLSSLNALGIVNLSIPFFSVLPKFIAFLSAKV